MDPTEDDTQGRSAVQKGVTVGTLIASASLAATLLIWSHTVFVGLIDWIVDMDRRIATNTQARLDGNDKFEHWISQILTNRSDIRANERALADLRALSHTQPDVFTGATNKPDQRELVDDSR